MSFDIDIQNPNLDPLVYTRNFGIFNMFLNVRLDNQRNWIIEEIKDLKRKGTYLPLQESKGTLMYDQRIYLILILFFLLQW